MAPNPNISGPQKREYSLLILQGLDPYPPTITRRASPPPNVRRATLGGGGGVEAAGDEEHAESVVVVVAEAAGDAAGEFDEAVHGLGAAVG